MLSTQSVTCAVCARLLWTRFVSGISITAPSFAGLSIWRRIYIYYAQ